MKVASASRERRAQLFLPVMSQFQKVALALSVTTRPSQPVQEKDPFDLFSGTRLSGEGPYHVQAEPKAIESVRAVIEVLKIRTMTLEAPNGDTEEEISLRIRFKKGGKSKARWLEVGESSRILGLAVKVLKGGDTYVEARKEYFPYALLEVK